MANLNNLTGHTDSTLPEDEQAEEVVSSFNTIINLLSDSVHDVLTVTISDGAASPTEASTTLGADNFLSSWLIIVNGTPSIQATLILPSDADDSKQFAVINNTGQVLVIEVSGAGSPQEIASLANGETAVCHYDGNTNVRKIVSSAADTIASGTLAYDFGFAFGDTPTVGSVIQRVRIGRAITIPANFSGASGGVQTNPTVGDYVVTVEDDGSQIGTITIDTSGTVTFATDGGAAKSVASGSEITFTADSGSPTETDIAGGSFVIQATQD